MFKRAWRVLKEVNPDTIIMIVMIVWAICWVFWMEYKEKHKHVEPPFDPKDNISYVNRQVEIGRSPNTL